MDTVEVAEVVRIVGPDDELPGDINDFDEFLCGNIDNVYLWQIGRRWSFPNPVPCHGKLNLWRPPEEIHVALDQQLKAAGASVRVPQ